MAEVAAALVSLTHSMRRNAELNGQLAEAQPRANQRETARRRLL